MTNRQRRNVQRNKQLEKIAFEIRGIETLNLRNNDDLDFYEISVWTLEEMLIQAFEEGAKSNN